MLIKWVMALGFAILVLGLIVLLGQWRKGQEMRARSDVQSSRSLITESLGDEDLPHIREIGDAQFEIERRALEEWRAWKSQERRTVR